MFYCLALESGTKTDDSSADHVIKSGHLVTINIIIWKAFRPPFDISPESMSVYKILFKPTSPVCTCPFPNSHNNGLCGRNCTATLYIYAKRLHTHITLYRSCTQYALKVSVVRVISWTVKSKETSLDTTEEEEQ